MLTRGDVLVGDSMSVNRDSEIVKQRALQYARQYAYQRQCTGK